jgi:import inner membrane translocase subunit TIM23
VRGKHDAANTIAAGGLSGMLFKSTRGLRPMLISGGIVASVAGVWAVSYSTTSPLLFISSMHLSSSCPVLRDEA